jgi:hypothetical protein
MRYRFLTLLVLSYTFMWAQDRSTLELYLPLDGEVIDRSPNDHDFTTQSVTFGSDRSGAAGMAAALDGSTNSIILDDDGIIVGNDLTIAGWLNFEGTLPSQQSSQVINKYRWDPNERSFRVACEESLLKFLVWYGPQRPDHVEVAVPLPENVWNHFAFSIAPDNLFRVYFNGCVVASKQLPGPMILGRPPLRIGNANYYGPSPRADNHHFNGRLDDLRIYRTTLPEGEIERLAERQPDHGLPEPKLELTFNGSLVDSSGQAYLLRGRDISYGQGKLDTIPGGALLFNGTSTEVILDRDELSQANDFTVAGWFNYAGTLPSQQTSTVLSKYTWDDGERSLRLECLDSVLTLSVWYGFTLDERVDIQAPITPGTWQKFAFTLTPDNVLMLFVDDCLVGTKHMPGAMRLSDQPLRIGNTDQYGTTAPGGNHHFHGLLDEIQVYDRALTYCQLPEIILTPYTPPVDTTTTSVASFRELGFEVFPNPATATVSVRTPGGEAELSLYDIRGRRLSVPTTADQIDVSGLPRGTYLLKAVSRRATGTSWIVKQ